MSGLFTHPTPKRDDRGHDDKETTQTTSDIQIADRAADAEPRSEVQAPSGKKYSIFTTTEKRGIVLAAAAGAFFSPLSAQIYFPALDALSRDLGISVTEVNLTVTTYM
ncbi:hypothetical protein E0Z10_g10946, partial [Xylaria hypoxylon]